MPVEKCHKYPKIRQREMRQRIEYKKYKFLKEEYMKIDFNEKDKLLNLEIDEEIDHHRADNLRRIADYEIQRRNPKRVILDFNNVFFMDSAGIGMVIGRYKTASMVGAKLEMRNVKENIKRIFEMTGILKIIPIIEEENKNEKTIKQ